MKECPPRIRFPRSVLCFAAVVAIGMVTCPISTVKALAQGCKAVMS